jgi:hypothetical protein
MSFDRPDTIEKNNFQGMGVLWWITGVTLIHGWHDDAASTDTTLTPRPMWNSFDVYTQIALAAANRQSNNNNNSNTSCGAAATTRRHIPKWLQWQIHHMHSLSIFTIRRLRAVPRARPHVIPMPNQMNIYYPFRRQPLLCRASRY